MTKLLTYHNDPAIRDKYHKRMQDHLDADELIQGIGFQDGRGCFIGCILDSYEHNRFPTEIGVPEELAYLMDAIFEELNKEESRQFFVDFKNHVPEGKDLSMIWPKFIWHLLYDSEHGLLKYVQGDEYKHRRDSIERVGILYREWIDTGIKPSSQKWEAAWAAAGGAIWNVTAWPAARAAALPAARTASWIAEAAAGAAAWVAKAEAGAAIWAARAAAGAASWAAREYATTIHWQWYRDLLMQLMIEAPQEASKRETDGVTSDESNI